MEIYLDKYILLLAATKLIPINKENASDFCNFFSLFFFKILFNMFLKILFLYGINTYNKQIQMMMFGSLVDLYLVCSVLQHFLTLICFQLF